MVWQAVRVRTAYRCRAYPDAPQQAMLNRTFGCVRVVWNQILAARQERYATERQGTSYGQASAALTAMKKDPQRAWLNEVSCVPLQQALRHLGVHDFAVTSDGDRVGNPRHLERRAANLARYQRRLARCQPGSANRAKAKAKVARAHRKVRNARQDFLHRTTTQLIRGNDLIAIAAGLAAARGFPGDACGADVRHLETPPVQSAVKQEPQLARAGIPVFQSGE
jgi:transposase